MSICACLVCRSPNSERVEEDTWRDGSLYRCPNCGVFWLSGTAEASLGSIANAEKAALSHYIWKNQGESPPIIDTLELGKFFPEPPPIDKQVEYLAMYTRDNQATIGSEVAIAYANLRAKIGAVEICDVVFIIDEAIRRGLIEEVFRGLSEIGIRLTGAGREWVHQRQSGDKELRRVFMAMSFRDEAVRRIVKESFLPALQEMGYQLETVADNPKAGLIDTHICNDIDASEFVISDLTGNNCGAYWEAGYATAKGKVVIYTCARSQFDADKTHFDTNHHQTVLWDLEDQGEAAEQLKRVVRNSISHI